MEAIDAFAAAPSNAELSGSLTGPVEGGVQSRGDGTSGACELALLREYGVIHLRGCLSERGQKELWALTKPYVDDPTGRATGFSNFLVSSRKKRRTKRVPAFDAFGAKVFGACAQALRAASEDGSESELSYARLLELAKGTKALKLDEIFGNYYQPGATLQNHVDCDGILLTMTVALGDACEFAIGKPTGRATRLSERSGEELSITMRSGDAVFFDGGSVPHQVKRILPKTAPSWWDAEKVPNGSRCVVVFREEEEDFYEAKIRREGAAAKKMTS
jgi:hypothetical protein